MMSESRRPTGHGPGRSEARERVWRQHVERQRRSERTIRDYCAQSGISEPSFYDWRSELARRDSVTSPPARSESKVPRRTSTSTPRFLPVTITSPVVSYVEVALPSGLLVRVPAQDTAALRTVLELLGPRSC
jgi:hypothetical protein